MLADSREGRYVDDDQIPFTMAYADVQIAPGLPDTDAIYAANTFTKQNAPASKLTQESLKRSFKQFSAVDDASWEFSAHNSPFDPDKHLAFEEPKYIHTMEDIGLPASNGVSNFAVSEPFHLFTEEAVDLMREEILAKEVQEKYSWTSDIAPKQLRGYAPQAAKFIYDAWKHPKTLAIVSKIAGVDLVPVVDYEIGHINISTPGKVQEHDKDVMIADDDQKAVVDWHKDSYPFVCVLMMSNTDGMIGGETALRTGTGDVKKVRGPSKGCAVVLQGRYIEHQALRAFGSQERITMVTSFRCRSPFIKDDTVLNTVRPISNLSDLYGQVVEYQLENMEARVRRMLKRTRASMRVGKTDVKAIKEFLNFELDALTHLNKEIIEEDKVKKGALAEMIAAERAAEAAAKRIKMA